MRLLRLGALALHSLSPEELFTSGEDEFRQVVTVNAEIFTLAHQDQELGALLLGTLNTIDGRVLQSLARARCGGTVQKQSGSDFIWDLAAWCAAKGQRLYLLGASTESNSRATRILQNRFPTLQVMGESPPYHSNPAEAAWNEAILRNLATFRPEQLVVCFGPPGQEKWIARHRDALAAIGVKVAYGLGGAIDFVSGTQKRAPRWVQRVGAEWLYRFIWSPRRRFRRTARMFLMPYYALRGSARASALRSC